MLSDDHIRNVMLSLFFSKLNGNHFYEHLEGGFKEGARVLSTVCNRFSKFKAGDYPMEDEGSSGRQRGLFGRASESR